MTSTPEATETMASHRRNATVRVGASWRSKGGFLVTLFCCMLLVGYSFYSFLCASDTADSSLVGPFVVLGTEGIFFAVLILIKNERSGIYMFEPFTMVTLVMALVYFVAPISQFASGSTARYGIDVTEYCIPATLLVMLGYFAFFVAYEFPVNRHLGKKKRRGMAYRQLDDDKALRYVRWAYIIWIVAYALNLFYYLNKGFDIVYIVFGGFIGAEDNSELIDSSASFLSYMKFILLGSWMMIYAYGESKVGKAVTYALLVLCMFLGGGRMTLLVALLAPVVFYYARHGKSPRFSTVVVAALGLIALFALMQVVRAGLRTGAGLDLSGLSLDEFLNPFYAEINDFMSYYALLDTVPEKHDFLYGSQMILYSFVFLIPRAIFPAKPDPAVHELVRLSLGQQAVSNGNAYPAIGEYYVEFGVPGVIVLMVLFGLICRALMNLYLDSEGKSLSMMAYSIVYPMLISIVIRGYFPQNFSTLLFFLGPMLLFLLLARGDERRAGDETRMRRGPVSERPSEADHE